jgi:hypothetical protein
VRAALAGELFLGVNDNHLGDNFGAWSVSVRLTPRATATTATAPVPVQQHPSGSSRLVPIGAVALAVLVVVTLGLVLLSRRRAAARRAVATDPEHPEDFLPRPRTGGAPEAPEPEVAAPEAALAPIETPARPAPAEVNLSDDPNDVNIFEVEFPGPASLRVGYSYFPDGTVVLWRVRQSATSGSNGEFVADGGGRAIHFVTIPLGSALEADAGGVDVEFNWEIAGVPFGYSVTRAPA